MTKMLSPILAHVTGYDCTALSFWCPGCGEEHIVWTGRDSHPVWSYNGDPNKPTFRPSLLVTTGHYVTERANKDLCWCTYNAEHSDDPGPACVRCHSWITDGKIQFLEDSTHALAGQTVDIPPFPERFAT